MNLPISITPHVDVADPNTVICNVLNGILTLKSPYATPTEKSSTLIVKARKNNKKNVSKNFFI